MYKTIHYNDKDIIREEEKAAEEDRRLRITIEISAVVIMLALVIFFSTYITNRINNVMENLRIGVQDIIELEDVKED